MAFWSRKVEKGHAAALIGEIEAPSGSPVDPQSGFRPDGWQARAWELWQGVGELHSPTTYIARVISRRIAWKTEQMNADTVARILTQALGKTNLESLVRLMVLNLQVAGEFWLVQTGKGDDLGWAVYAVTQDGLAKIIEDAEKSGLTVRRVYEPHPADQTRADSPMRNVLDPAEDLLTLSALSRAQSRSRISQAGILIYPQEAAPNGDPFGAPLKQAMSAAIKDVGAPSAFVPITVGVPFAVIEGVKHITFERSFDDKIPGRVENAIRRIALGLDIPPELLLGMAQANHWSAWVVQDEVYNANIAPLAEVVASVLEFVILTSLGQDLTLVPDASELRTKVPPLSDVLEAYRLGIVSGDYVLKVAGATAQDKMTDEEREWVLQIAGRATSSDTVDQSQSAPNDGVAP